jgi:Zn-dependent metalloprotease
MNQRLWLTLSGLMAVALNSHAVEQYSLVNESHIWPKVQAHLLNSNEVSRVDSRSVQGAELAINYRAIKTIGTDQRYQHYQVYLGDIPIWDNRFVLLVDKAGNIEQGLGNVLLTKEGFSVPHPTPFKLSAKKVKEKLIQRLRTDAVAFVNEPKVSKAFIFDDGELRAVFVANVITPSHRVNLIVDAQSFTVIRQENDIDGFSAGQNFVTGGGIGGNEKLGAICYSPAPASMQNCLAYKFAPEEPIASELIFTDPTAHLFSDFSGYPFVVSKHNDVCTLENPYVKTIDYLADKSRAVSYQCGDNNEHFDKTVIDDQYYDYFTYSGVNEAHFNAGLVMQYYHKLLTEMFPHQQDLCDPHGFCIKQLAQNVGNNTFGNSQANWDDTYANYGTGNYGGTHYYHTTLDIVSHEASHAVTYWNSQLNATGQDGALNEAFSDIASIAVFDYLSQNVSGTYKDSSAFNRKSLDSDTDYRGSRKWWFGWDVLYEDTGARYFAMPSWDGKSIDHFKSYNPSQSIYETAGVFRKAFYELVKTQTWSIQDAFKLFLRANVNCFFKGMSVQDAGMCLIDQASHFGEIGSESEVEQQIDATLHSVGIVAQNSQLSTLSFESSIQYDVVNYTIGSVPANQIKAITVEWGDGFVERWQQNSTTEIHTFLKRSRLVEIDDLIRFKLTVQKTDDSELVGYRHYYSRAVRAACPPVQAQGNASLSSITVNGQQITLNNQPYQSVLTETHAFNKHTEQVIAFDDSLNGKLVSVLFDNNRDGLFSESEIAVSNQTISNGQVKFKLKDNTVAGVGLIRVSLGGQYAFYEACGYVKASQVVDLKAEVNTPELPLKAGFTYQISADNRVEFTNTSQVNAIRQPSYLWRFGFDDQESTQENPDDVQYPLEDGTYTVYLRIDYQDGSGQSDEFSQQITLSAPAQCQIGINNTDNAQAIYIDEMYLWTSIHSRDLVEGALGTNPTGYIKHQSGLEFLDGLELNVDIRSNVLDESTIDNLLSPHNRDVRFTIWLDANRDELFQKNEANYYDINSNYTKDCRNGECRIKVSQSIRLPRISWWQSRQYVLRARLEEHPTSEHGSDGCRNFDYGEVEDVQFTVNGI